MWKLEINIYSIKIQALNEFKKIEVQISKLKVKLFLIESFQNQMDINAPKANAKLTLRQNTDIPDHVRPLFVLRSL
jgi:hypothetical protein